MQGHRRARVPGKRMTGKRTVGARAAERSRCRSAGGAECAAAGSTFGLEGGRPQIGQPEPFLPSRGGSAGCMSSGNVCLSHGLCAGPLRVLPIWFALPLIRVPLSGHARAIPERQSPAPRGAWPRRAIRRRGEPNRMAMTEPFLRASRPRTRGCARCHLHPPGEILPASCPWATAPLKWRCCPKACAPPATSCWTIPYHLIAPPMPSGSRAGGCTGS